MSDTTMPANMGRTTRPLRQSCAGLGAVTVEERILAIGGLANGIPFDFVEIRRLWGAGKRRDVTPRPPLDNLTTAVLDGRVYAMGGTTPDVQTDVVEIYHPERTTGSTSGDTRVSREGDVMSDEFVLTVQTRR